MRLVLFALMIATLYAQPKPLPKDRADDSYVVYSAVLPKLSSPDADRKYLIEDTTGLGDSDLLRCIRVPADYAAKFDEIRADYARYKTERFQLERKFVVDRPYELLSEAEGKQFRDSRMRQDDPERFRGATHLMSFSNVYFDKSRTFAVVRTGVWCGGLCGQWMWRAMVKENGPWVEKPWGACFAVARSDDHGFGVPKNPILSTLASTATSKKPTIISSQLCSPQRTSAFGSGLRGLFAELSK